MNKPTILLFLFHVLFAGCDKAANPSLASSIGVGQAQSQPKVIVQTPVAASEKKLLPLVQIIDPLELLQLNNVLASVGRIEMPNDSYGTGVCVSRNQVLTAFHVVKEKDAPLPTGVMEFFALDEDGLALVKHKQVEIRYLRHSKPFDLALYEIADQDFNCRTLPLADQGPKPGTLVRRFGFNAGWKWTLGVFVKTDLKIDLTPGASGITDRDLYEMPVFFGASGGPILSMSGLFLGTVVQVERENPATVTNSLGQSGFEHTMYTVAIPLAKVKLFLNEPETPKLEKSKKKK